MTIISSSYAGYRRISALADGGKGNTKGSIRSNFHGDIDYVYASGRDSTLYPDSSAGILISGANDRILNATSVDNAFVAAANGAILSNGYASSAGSIDALNGGTAINPTAGSSGAIAAAVIVDDNDKALGGKSDGGVVINPHVMSGGYSLTGGAPGLEVKGYKVQGSGGETKGGTFDEGSTALVGRGGIARNGNYYGTQILQSNGVAISGLFDGAKAIQEINAGVASAATAINGAQLHVSGGSGNGLTAMNGGNILVEGGNYQDVFANGMGAQPNIGAYRRGSTYNNNVQNGGLEVTGSGAVTTSSHISSGGLGTVMSGGTANGVDANGGTEFILSGGSIADGSASNNGLIDIESGAVGSNVRTNTGGFVNIHSGASLSGVFTINGGSQTIESGATVSGVDVAAGNFSLQPGPSVSQVRTLSSGATAIIQDGVQINNLQASGGGYSILNDGAITTNVLANTNGTVELHGHADTATAQNSGILILKSNGDIGSFNVNGGTGYIEGGKVASDVSVIGSSTGNSVWNTTRIGGTLNLNSGANLQDQKVVASSGGSIVANSGATASNLVATSSGAVIASNGAVGNDILISGNNASGTVLSGAQYSSMSIDAGGNGTAAEGAVLDQMHITNGKGTLQSGATVRELRIHPGGSGLLMPGASAMDITVASGGWVSGATLTSGNSMIVASSGTALDTLVTDSSSDMSKAANVMAGGSAVNTNIAAAASTSENGGLLNIQSGADLRNTSIGYNGRIRIIGLNYADGGKTTLNGNTLTVTQNGQTWTTTLRGSYHGNGPGDSGFRLINDGQGNTIVVYDQCFLAGTLIRLEQGDVAVETLKRGDKIRTYVDGREEIREITKVAKSRAEVHTDLPEDMAGWSVIVSKNAFAEGVPSQDLAVTPEHCFYLNGRFVPARMLVNDQTICYDHTKSQYDFYHVETEIHSIIWANNTLTESFLDTGERRYFENDDDNVAHLVPLRNLTWENDAAAALETSQSFVEPIFKKFQQRALTLGHPAPSLPAGTDKSDDADIRLQLDDGTVLKPTRRVNDRVLFSFPARHRSVKLLSRRFKPSESIGPFVDDRRILGVLVGAVDLWTGGRENNITEHLSNKELQGWDVIEAGAHRWTHGNAVIPMPEQQVQDGEINLLSIQIQAGGPYLLATAETMPEVSAV